MYEYQYTLFRGQLDFFAPLPPGEMGQPNCHLVTASAPMTKAEFAAVIEHLRGGDVRPPHIVRIGGIR